MYALVSPEKIQLPAGTVVRGPATWQDYQMLLKQRGDGSVPRIKYQNGVVCLMSPLPVHGRDSSLVADIVKTLLDRDERDYDAFTPVTMELPESSGIEPDYCFYIDHWADVSGKERIDWQNDPPPDLVIEIDVTSYSNVEDYWPYQVPEIWLLRRKQLSIYQPSTSGYKTSENSLYFPRIDLPSAIARCLDIAYKRNTSAAIRDLRKRLA
ncbi:MAG: Uma2 family endonuclease [Cyanobacteria bacterium J06606_4]